VEPIGTITMCFPHVDDKTRSTLQSVMDEAENLGDFTERLCDRVCVEPSSSLLGYFAAQFAFWIEHHALLDKLHSAGKMSDLAFPLLLMTRDVGTTALSWDSMMKSVKRALMAAPNDWIACHSYLSWRLIAEYTYPESDVDVRPIEVIVEKIEKNSDFECFNSYLLWMKAHEYEREGNNKEAIRAYKQALTTARKFDDQLMMADIIRMIAALTRLTDAKQATDLFISSRDLSVKLGYKCGVGKIQRELGLMKQFRGEFDAAMEYELDWKRIADSIGRDSWSADSLIACMYNQYGKGKEAYRLAKTAVDFADHSSGDRWLSRPHMELAWAYINLGKYDKAEEELAIAHKIATRSGSSGRMMWIELVEGILDKAEGNFDNAALIFKKVLGDLYNNLIQNIFLFNLNSLIQNVCLLNLTEIEIELLTDDSLNKNSDSAGPWMTKLEEHAKKNDLPGIAARALLLKAELRRKQGRFDDMRTLLKQVQETAKSPSMKYLNDLAISMFPDIIVA
jgi:tetratricopeptide (TPR) repeat protein